MQTQQRLEKELETCKVDAKQMKQTLEQQLIERCQELESLKESITSGSGAKDQPQADVGKLLCKIVINLQTSVELDAKVYPVYELCIEEFMKHEGQSLDSDPNDRFSDGLALMQMKLRKSLKS